MWSDRKEEETEQKEKGKRKWKRGTLGEACIHKGCGKKSTHRVTNYIYTAALIYGDRV